MGFHWSKYNIFWKVRVLLQMWTFIQENVIVSEQIRNLTGKLPQTVIVICCNFLCRQVSQCIPCIQRHSLTYKIIQNFNVHSYRNSIDLSLSRSSSVHDFKTVSLSWLTLLQTLMEYLRQSFCPQIF